MKWWRWVVAAGIVVATGAVLVIALSGRTNRAPNTTVATSTTDATATTTTSIATTDAVTSTTTAEQRLAEVEKLLEELWFGWFDAIYRKDEAALWRVVATTNFHDAGVAAMDSLSFVNEPAPEAVDVVFADILLDRSDCLVVHYEIAATTILGQDAISREVGVLWPDSRYGWRLATVWQLPGDLWLDDCDNLQREQTP